MDFLLTMRALGYFCHYVPEELLVACGFEAICFEPDFSLSVSPLFPVPFCALCKSFTQWAINHKDLSGFVVPLACDASRRTYETLRALNRSVFPLDVPASSSPEAVQYFAENLKILSEELLALSGVSWEAFENTLRKALQEAPKKSESAENRPSLLLLGSHFASAILPLLEARGFVVLADIPKERPYIFLEPFTPSLSPLVDLARLVLLHRLPCPRFPGKVRREFLKKLCRELPIRGVIIFFSKFCDPQLYEIGLLRRELEVPVLLLEHDLTSSLAQWETRLDAFLEMIRHG